MKNVKYTVVDSDLLKQTAKDVGMQIREMQALLIEMENSTMDNLSPYWKGKAKEEFESKLTSTIEELRELISNYEEFLLLIKKAVMEYEEADETAKKLVSKLAVY